MVSNLQGKARASVGAVVKRKHGCLQNSYAGVRFPSAPLMSVEHGSHGEAPSFIGIIQCLILALLGIRAITEPVEDVVKWAVVGGGGHGH